MAGRICTICIHPEREALEAAIQAGGSFKPVAAAFNIQRDALRRHMQGGHVGRPVPTPDLARQRRYIKHQAKVSKKRYTEGGLSSEPLYPMEPLEPVTPPAPELPPEPKVPRAWVQVPVDALAHAERSPTIIPNAYQQLEQLNALLYDIINAAEPKGKDGGQAPEWVMVADRQYRLGAMRELRSTIAATLKLWEAQRAIEERYSGSRPLHASEIVVYLRKEHPAALAGLLEHLRQQRIDTTL